MKRAIAFIFALVCVLSLAGCGKDDTHAVTITIRIPAGSRDPFVFSDEEIAPTGDTITISSFEGSGDTKVLLMTVNELLTPGYVATYLTPGMPVRFDTSKGEWLKVGVAIQNPTDTDMTFRLEVRGVEVKGR